MPIHPCWMIGITYIPTPIVSIPKKWGVRSQARADLSLRKLRPPWDLPLQTAISWSAPQVVEWHQVELSGYFEVRSDWKKTHVCFSLCLSWKVFCEYKFVHIKDNIMTTIIALYMLNMFMRFFAQQLHLGPHGLDHRITPQKQATGGSKTLWLVPQALLRLFLLCLLAPNLGARDFLQLDHT